MPGGVNLGFARAYRLTKTDEYSSVFGFRKAIRGSSLMLHYLPRQPASVEETGTSLPPPRLGLVIGKKFLKRAVDRNRVKRILREAFRLCRPNLPACDLVVRLHGKLAVIDNQALVADFHRLLDKLRQPARGREKS